MHRKKLLLALFVAGVTGLAAGVLTLNYLKRPSPAVAADQPAAGSVVVAAAAVPLGTYLTEQHVKTVAWPGTDLPEGYFARKQDVVGRGVIVDLSPSEPVLATKLAPEGAGGGLPVVIPGGHRAVSVKVDEVVGVAGFVLPGTRVDVLVTLNPETEGETQAPARTRVILQNVKVLASGQKIEKDEEGKPQTVTVITLLVTPEESEKLTLAATEGQIQMALRNAMDLDSVSTTGIETAELVSGPSAPVPAPRPRARASGPVRPARNVEVILGAERSMESF
ncbi:MAG: Flp pilus assembly protein CpaB [Gemmatimonadota bacterium]